MTRRHWLVVGGFILSGACGRRKATGFPGYALIATSGDQSVAVVDLTTFRLLKAIPVGAAPTAIVSAGPENRSYVLTPSTGSVHIIDADLQVVRSHKLAGELSEIRLTPDGKTLIAISAQSHELIEADPVTLRVNRRYKLDAPPMDLDASETGYVAVSTGSAGIVSLVHLGTGQRRQTQLPGQIGPVRFRSDGKLLLVANFQDRCLTALDVPGLGVVADLSLAMVPENLCFGDPGQLFVSGEGMDGIAIVFPYNALEVEQTVLAGRDPGVMTASINPAYLLVASNTGSDVCILNIQDRKVIGLVDVGERATYITVTPDSQYALILDELSGVLAVVHLSAIQQSSDAGYNFRRKSGAWLFAMVEVGSKPVHAAIVPRVS